MDLVTLQQAISLTTLRHAFNILEKAGLVRMNNTYTNAHYVVISTNYLSKHMLWMTAHTVQHLFINQDGDPLNNELEWELKYKAIEEVSREYL